VNADSEQDALLEAIFATPADDTPRLVYADWLDEHSEPEYAEFIRVQIECARQPSPSLRKPIERREREVWKTIKRKWGDLLAPPTIVRKDNFRRGFVSGSAEETCTIPADRFLERSADLWPRLPLRCVQLTAASGSVAFPTALLDCAHLRRLTRLEVLSGWYGPCVNEELVVQLFSRDRFDRLSDLTVQRVPFSRSVVDALRSAPYLPRLRHLYILGISLKGGPYDNNWLSFPSGDEHPEEDGAVAMLAKALPALEPYLVVVPPGETNATSILEHTRSLGPAAP
jgi:uncharacterized protein (TIGR02996 family)